MGLLVPIFGRCVCPSSASASIESSIIPLHLCCAYTALRTDNWLRTWTCRRHRGHMRQYTQACELPRAFLQMYVHATYIIRTYVHACFDACTYHRSLVVFDARLLCVCVCATLRVRIGKHAAGIVVSCTNAIVETCGFAVHTAKLVHKSMVLSGYRLPTSVRACMSA